MTNDPNLTTVEENSPADATLTMSARPGAEHAFGHADRHGIVGEGAAIWELRKSIAFIGQRQGHVLIQGPSGTGKELVARALHASSAHARRPLVSRNAATLPEGLVDAELFGSARNYPNAGMPERPGLVEHERRDRSRE